MKNITSLFGVKKGFTLLELMVSMTVFLILITAVTTIFINLYKIKGGLEARQRITQESYFLLEKLQTMMKDYTIDYEEYWNRQRVGCSEIGNPNWNTGGNCSVMTYYGNNNITESAVNITNHKLFYCSSQPIPGDDETVDYTVGISSTDSEINLVNYINSCLVNVTKSFISNVDEYGFLQSYGQYSVLHTNVKSNVDYIPGPAGDDDDVNIGNNINAIATDADGNVQELYLISHDKQRRMFIRRKLKEDLSDGFVDRILTPSEKLYTLQVLQLRGFDAGQEHNFDSDTKGVYDGKIDTWACDYGAGFICVGDSIQGAFSNYRLPSTGDDGWKDLLGSDITVTDRKIAILPLKDPLLARDDLDAQQSPHLRISLTTQLYAKNWTRKLTLNQMNSYVLPLQTMFSFTD